jgi:hypothetical protein
MRRLCLGSVAVLVVLAAPSSALGAVTIGSNLSGAPFGSFTCVTVACTFAHQTLPPTSEASGGVLAPSDGVVVRWRVRVGLESSPMALRITRPGDSNTRESVATGQTETPSANATSTFDERLSIRAGDALGIDCCENDAASPFGALGLGVSSPYWLPRLVDGDPARTGGFHQGELLINADIEPDCDNDGFGDETQDQDGASCPPPGGNDTDPPETEITKGAPNKLDKHKVKFKFTSDEPGSTFECKLDKREFKPCKSPKKVKRLDDGKHRFKVIATDEAGNSDPSAAKDKFKVVD